MIWCIQGVLDSLNNLGGGIIIQSPKDFNSEIYNGTISIMNNGVMPIAYVILGLFFMLEIYNITIRNDLGQGITGVEVPFKVFFKMAVCKVFIDSIPKILDAIYSISALIITKVNLGGGGDVDLIDIDKVKAVIEQMGYGTQLMNCVLVSIIWLVVMFIGLMITVIVVGRMIQMYVMFAIAPIPLSTIPNAEWSSIAKNFLKDFAAVCLQGTLIFIVLAIFKIIMGKCLPAVTEPTEFLSAMLQAAGYAIILLIAIFQTGRWAKTFCNVM